MSILLTGGIGKTSSRIASLLLERGIPTILTSRRAEGTQYSGTFVGRIVKFDWLDESTFENPFTFASALGPEGRIKAIYLVMPPFRADSFSVVKPFIDLAVSKGVKRFVLMSVLATEKGMLGHGKVHEYLVDLGVEYAILRPSWFFGELSERLI
jgi:festuclavine dehydrogenase